MQPPQRHGGTLAARGVLRTCPGGAGTTAEMASVGRSWCPPWATPTRTPPPLSSSWSRSSAGPAAHSLPWLWGAEAPKCRGSPKIHQPPPARKPLSCPATSCTPACAGVHCPPTAAPPASSSTPAPAQPGRPAAPTTMGRSCAARGSNGSGCNGQRWTCCWPTVPLPGHSGPWGSAAGCAHPCCGWKGMGTATAQPEGH